MIIKHTQLAVRTVPYRKDFVESLKKDPSVTEEQVVEDTKASIAKMKTNIDEINLTDSILKMV